MKPFSPEHHFLKEHSALLLYSFEHWTGRSLLLDPSHTLWKAPYAVVSHGTQSDPIFNYGNETALKAFAMTWSQFTQLPSRKSAEPMIQAERDQLMQRVTQNGFIDDYQGIRIAATGQRFAIEEATVWNVIDEQGVYHGQAAVLYQWSVLE